MAVAHTRIELQGTVSTNRDIWSCSLSAPTQPDLEFVANATIEAFLAEVWNASGIGTNWSSQTSFTSVRASEVDAAGHIVSTFTSTEELPEDGNGSSGQIPSECSIVCSLVTALAGGSHRGRIYLPPVCKDALDGDGLLAVASRNSIADGMQSFLQALNLGLTGHGEVDVFSPTLGVLTPVVAIKVGRVVDSQRRRRNRIPESYTTRVL